MTAAARLPAPGRCALAASVVLPALTMLLAAYAPSGAPPDGVNGQASNGPRLALKDRTHDFGKLSASRKTEYQFAFTTAGSETLQIGEITLAPGGPGG